MTATLLSYMLLSQSVFSLFTLPCKNCPDGWVGDGYCDSKYGCISGPCNYDQSKPGLSDCDSDCKNSGCDLTKRVIMSATQRCAGMTSEIVGTVHQTAFKKC